MLIAAGANAQTAKTQLLTGARQTQEYLSLLDAKRVAVVANHTSLIGQEHLVDHLLHLDLDVVKVFSPEHGFRGQADAGEKVDDKIDLVTGLPILSLYGKQRKPDSTTLSDVDVVVFDIQDVGARFYTYISTMSLVMEACAEENIPVIVLDRPNPNGFYVDGPVLDTAFKSFVGMHPVPVVHGMTVGEYALMINGERWLPNGRQCPLTVVPMIGYSHSDYYELPVKPSPNLPNEFAVYLYPSLCFFEGTDVSIGRGTDYPFQVAGHPEYLAGNYIFVPRSIPGVATNPKHEGVYCNGINLISFAQSREQQPAQLHWQGLINFYQGLHDS
ncbi:MAG: DUF1343 domain-containing protein, partial [Bacteroidales bacterium]|nr:DUF1343 domain-containing protein [Bacteroidales bacterium]